MKVILFQGSTVSLQIQPIIGQVVLCVTVLRGTTRIQQTQPMKNLNNIIHIIVTDGMKRIVVYSNAATITAFPIKFK